MLPFDAGKLQRLMGERGVDLVLASTRHNVRHLTGGYYVPFHARAPRFGAGQYMSVVGVPAGDLQASFYVGRRDHVLDEPAAIEVFGGIWIEDRRWFARGGSMTASAAERTASAVREHGFGEGVIAVEMPFLPADAFQILRRELPAATWVDATPVLAELRCIKRPEELEQLRRIHRDTAEAIRATLVRARAEQTTREVAASVARGIAERGSAFSFCYTNVGPGLLRWPSGRTLGRGNPVHIDAGGELGDFVSDVTRMGSVGEPTALARQVFAACTEAQERVQRELAAGMSCGDLHRLGEEAIRAAPFGACGRFVAHGLGAVIHEPPLIASGETRPLEPGMVLSIETEYLHPEAGHIKIEDSVAVTATGCEGLGNVARDWYAAAG